MSDIRVGHAELLRFCTDLFVAKGMLDAGVPTASPRYFSAFAGSVAMVDASSARFCFMLFAW